MDRRFMFMKTFSPQRVYLRPKGYIHASKYSNMFCNCMTDQSQTSVCINGQGNLTKMAARAINSKKQKTKKKKKKKKKKSSCSSSEPVGL